MSKPDKLAPSKEIAAEVIYITLQILKENKDGLHRQLIKKEVEKQADLSDWAKERLEKTNNLRWWSILQFYTIDCMKAGYLLKKKGIWYITPEGEKALKLDKYELLESAIMAFRNWKSKNNKETTDDSTIDIVDESITLDPSNTIDQVEQEAIDGIKNHISKMNPYEFQDLVAALLRGMGYYTPFVAPKGKDGGVDILAYRDAFGIETPRIKVQVKHRNDKTKVTQIRELIGILQKDGEVGIVVSSGGFTPDAISEAKSAHVHIELIDLDNFINLWQEFFKKLSDEDKNLLPLIPIYFLAPTE